MKAVKNYESYIATVQQVASRWRQDGVDLNSGATAAQLDAFEQQHEPC